MMIHVKRLSIQSLMDKIQYFLLLAYVSLVYIIGNNSELTVLYYIPLFLFLTIECGHVVKRRKLLFTKHILVTLLFTFICLLTCLWADDSAAVLNRFITILLLAISLLFMFNYCTRTHKDIDDLLLILLFSGIIFSIYLLFYYGTDSLFGIFSDRNMRFGEDINNVNVIGMELAIAVVTAVHFGITRSKKFFLLAIIPALLAFGTASKNAFIFILFGTTSLIILENNKKLSVQELFKKVFFPIVVLLTMILVIQFNVFPTLSRRLNDFSKGADNSTEIRGEYIRHGFEVFLNNPLIGVGINNSGAITLEVGDAKTYLHNNYIELLATTGLLGTLVYYYVFISLIVFSIVNYKNKHSPVVIIMLLLWLIMDWGSVSYYDKVTYLLILIGILHYSNTVKKDKNVYEIN